MRERLDVVDQRRAAEVPDLRRERRAQARHRAPALHRLEHRRLLAGDVRARADDDLEGSAIEETCFAELLERSREPFARRGVLLADVDEPGGRVGEAHRDHHALEEEVRPQLHDVAVLDRPRLALVGVDDDVARRRLARDGLPLDPGREARAAEAGEAGRLQLLDDPLVRGELAEQLEAAPRRVVGERLVAAPRPIAGPSLVACVTAGTISSP